VRYRNDVIFRPSGTLGSINDYSLLLVASFPISLIGSFVEPKANDSRDDAFRDRLSLFATAARALNDSSSFSSRSRYADER